MADRLSQFRNLIYWTAVKKRRRNPKLFFASSGLMNNTAVAKAIGVDPSLIKRIVSLERVFTSKDPGRDHGEYDPSIRLKRGLMHWLEITSEADLWDELEHAASAPERLTAPIDDEAGRDRM